MAYKRKPSTSKFRNEIVYPNLKKWLDSNNINAFEFAEMLNTCPSTLYDYLVGRTESLKLIRKVKETTGLRWEDLIKD